MTTYKRKDMTVEAWPHEGPGKLTVISVRKGEQFASVGDYLVVDQQERDKRLAIDAENADCIPPRAPEYNDRGTLYVIGKAEFEASFDVFDGSGSERWGASDWTAAGQDASGFPVEKGSAEDVTA